MYQNWNWHKIRRRTFRVGFLKDVHVQLWKNRSWSIKQMKTAIAVIAATSSPESEGDRYLSLKRSSEADLWVVSPVSIWKVGTLRHRNLATKIIFPRFGKKKALRNDDFFLAKEEWWFFFFGQIGMMIDLMLWLHIFFIFFIVGIGILEFRTNFVNENLQFDIIFNFLVKRIYFIFRC